MDRTSELADAYVELKFSEFEPQRTQICRKTLNPTWNEDFRFEVSDDADLQNEPLELKVLDYDAVTADDPIGAVNIDLNSLLFSQGIINGWFPIYDTLKKNRGELNVLVKLQFFGDISPLKDSHLGVLLFCSENIPSSFKVVNVIGFVDVLINDQDPEYHWSDSFRTPRSSNEARQRVLYRLSGNMRRLVSKKVLEMGGNAVVGYQQSFDIEHQEHAITARAVGTACKLIPIEVPKVSPLMSPKSPKVDGLGSRISSINFEVAPININAADVSPVEADDKASDAKSEGDSSSVHEAASTRKEKAPKNPELLFLTMKIFPSNSVVHIGGIVSAKSVKLLDTYDRNIRDAWWTELREEIKTHARALGCPHVIGYSESTTIHKDLCVMSVSGTAAVLDLTAFHSGELPPVNSPSLARSAGNFADERMAPRYSDVVDVRRLNRRRKNLGCFPAHVPYSTKHSPFPMNFIKCKICKKRYVPEVLFATIDPPNDLKIFGNGQYLTAFVCRSKRKEQGELNAAIVSDPIPFLEYDIHRQLMYKLRVYGCNAIFGLKLQITIGDTLISASASGTAFHLPALPLLPVIQISRNIRILDEEDRKLVDLQNKITNLSATNRETIEGLVSEYEKSDGDTGTDSDSSSSSSSSGYDRNRVIVQIDDDADEDIIAVILNPSYPEGFQLTNVETVPSKWLEYENSLEEQLIESLNRGLPKPPSGTFAAKVFHQQMITLVKEASIKAVSHHTNRQLVTIFNDLIYELLYTVMHFKNCCVSGIEFEVQHPFENDIRIQLTAVAIGNLEIVGNRNQSIVSSLSQVFRRGSLSSTHSGTLPKNVTGLNNSVMKSLSEEDIVQNALNLHNEEGPLDPVNSLADVRVETFSKQNKRESFINMEEDDNEDENMSFMSDGSSNMPGNNVLDFTAAIQNLVKHVEITPLSFVAGGTIEKYLGHLTLHFVKENNANTETAGAFFHAFIMEVHGIVRAHVIALGGNGLISYKLNQMLFNEKNPAYALVSVQGDMVSIEYEDRQAQENWVPLTHQYSQ
jgi:uncharacterized protein YbjQ (UPF0145 family)